MLSGIEIFKFLVSDHLKLENAVLKQVDCITSLARKKTVKLGPD